MAERPSLDLASLAQALGGAARPGGDLLRYGRALFPDQQDEQITGAIERSRSQGRDDRAILGEGVEIAKQRVPREWAARSKQIEQQYQDAVQREKALGEEQRRASTKWRLLGGLGAALAGRDPSAINSHFDQLEALNLERGMRGAREQRDAARGDIELEQQQSQADRADLLFEQGQQDRQFELQDRQRTRNASAREDDPNSEESLLAQGLASRMLGRPVQGVSASRLKGMLPGMERIYQIEQSKRSQQGGLSPELAYRMGRDAKLDERHASELEPGRTERAEKRTGELSTPYGPARDDDSATKLRGAYEQSRNLERALAQMKAVRERVGSEVFEREDVAEGQSAAAEAKLAVKELAKLGVLSSTDYMFLDQLIPSDPTSFDWVPFSDPIMKKIDQAIESAGAREKTALGAYLAPGGGQSAAADPPAAAAAGGRIRVTNGTETFEIDAADLPEAEADGYRRAN